MEIQSKDIETFEKKSVIDRIAGSVTTSVQVSPSLFHLAKENNIKFVEAMRTGISVLLAEKGVIDYDNNLNITRKITHYNALASEFSQKVHDLEEEIIKLKGGKNVDL